MDGGLCLHGGLYYSARSLKYRGDRADFVYTVSRDFVRQCPTPIRKDLDRLQRTPRFWSYSQKLVTA